MLQCWGKSIFLTKRILILKHICIFTMLQYMLDRVKRIRENFLRTGEQEGVNCRAWFNKVDSMGGKTDYLKLDM